MELTIDERIILTGILKGQEGKIAYMKALRIAREALEIDEIDHVVAGMEQDFECPQCHYVTYFPVRNAGPACPLCKALMKASSHLRWDGSAPPRDIKIGELATGVIAGHLMALEEQGKLTDDLVDLYEKFVK